MIIIVIGEFKVNRPSPIMSTVDDRFLRKSRIQHHTIDTRQSLSIAAVIIAFVQTIARDTQSLGPSAFSGHLDHHHSQSSIGESSLCNNLFNSHSG